MLPESIHSWGCGQKSGWISSFALQLTLNGGNELMSPSVTVVHPFVGKDLGALRPLRRWLDQRQIKNRRLARFLCKLIPAQCPFERDLVLFQRKIVHIPPLCQLNPLYEQLVGLRFRALSYLADQCQEDISRYC